MLTSAVVAISLVWVSSAFALSQSFQRPLLQDSLVGSVNRQYQESRGKSGTHFEMAFPKGRVPYRNMELELARYNPPTVYSSVDSHGWWKSLLGAETSPTTRQDEVSQSVDEYFRFLDKRYEQIHGPKKQSSQVISWFAKESFELNFKSALYALRQAEEACNSLIVRENVPEKESPDTVSQDGSDPAGSRRLGWPIRSLNPVYNWFVRARGALIKYEVLKVRQALSLLEAGLKRALKLPIFFLKLGGGKKPTAIAFGLLFAVVLRVIFPAVTAFVRETMTYRS